MQNHVSYLMRRDRWLCWSRQLGVLAVLRKPVGFSYGGWGYIGAKKKHA